MTDRADDDGAAPSGPTPKRDAPTVAVCAPVYNEGASIRETVQSWANTLRSQDFSFEIVLCDDGSTDDTLGALADLQEVPELRLVVHRRNRGAGSSVRTAVAHSRAEWLILIDSDGQLALDDALEMFSAVLDQGALAGIGFRRKKDRRLLVLGSRLTGWLANRIYGSHLKDFNCALKVVDGNACRSMNLRTTRFNYSTEMTSRILLMGLPLIEFPVGHELRASGQSSARVLRDGWARLMFLSYLRAERRLMRSGALDLGRTSEHSPHAGL